MFPEDCVGTLCDFGLTSNQARVYIACVRLGLGTVGKISHFCKVRREDVYRVLPKLEQMGLIERVLGTPVRIRALPVEDALAVLIRSEEDRSSRKVSELKTKKEEFLKQFRKQSGKIVEQDDSAQFTLISEKTALLNKGASLFKDVKQELDIVASRGKMIEFVFDFAEPLRKTIKNGAKIRMITELPEEEDQLPTIIEQRLSPGASLKLRYTERLPGHFVIVDGKELMLATTTDAAPWTERPGLWTANGPLIAILQSNFEDLWHSSVNWANFKTETTSERAARLARQMKPTEHAIFVYENPEIKYHVLFNYIKYGLENGEAALYICSEANPKQIRNAMKLFGINVEKYEKTGALKIIPYTEFYIINGKFTIPNTLNLWNRFYKESVAKGFKGLRATGETACFFKHNMVSELVEYEKALHRTLEIPMVAICSYHADRLRSVDDPIDLYRELVEAHGTVLYAARDKAMGKIEIRKG